MGTTRKPPVEKPSQNGTATKSNGKVTPAAKKEVKKPEPPKIAASSSDKPVISMQTNTLEERLRKIQKLDGAMKGIEKLADQEKHLSEFKTHANDSLQLTIVDSEGKEFNTGNTTFIRLSIDHDLELLRERKRQLEQEVMEAQL